MGGLGAFAAISFSRKSGFKGKGGDEAARRAAVIEAINKDKDLAELQKKQLISAGGTSEEIAKNFQGIIKRKKRAEEFAKEQRSILTDRPGQAQTILTSTGVRSGTTGGTILTGG